MFNKYKKLIKAIKNNDIKFTKKRMKIDDPEMYALKLACVMENDIFIQYILYNTPDKDIVDCSWIIKYIALYGNNYSILKCIIKLQKCKYKPQTFHNIDKIIKNDGIRGLYIIYADNKLLMSNLKSSIMKFYGHIK